MIVSQSTPHLILHTANGPSQWLLDNGSCWTVGRNEDSDFVLTNRWISRNHAMFQAMDNGDMYLIDLGSRNGSFLNGRRVGIPVIIRDGDHLTFGQTELTYHCPKSEITFQDLSRARDMTATATLHIRRLISVLVIDIRDYTVLTRSLDEQILSEMIGSWFRRSGEIIRKHGSWVDKYIGDAVMAVWIHRSQQTAKPEEIQPALQAINELNQMTQTLAARYPIPFPLRIGAGLNTGFAMVGNTGSGDRPDYTALGDTVNAAFRLESATKQAQLDILMGTLTQQCLTANDDLSEFFQPQSLRLKGYEDPFMAHGCSFDSLGSYLQQLALVSPKTSVNLG